MAGVIEVEVKARVIDVRSLERRVRALGGRFGGERTEVDTYFAHPSRDFARTDEALRLRLAGGRGELTYKGPKLDRRSKTREELKFGISDTAAAAAALERLGFTRVLTVRKRRRTYRLRGLEVMIDRVRGLGPYIEVEACTSMRGRGRVLERALALLEELGAGKNERRSYLELLLQGRT